MFEKLKVHIKANIYTPFPQSRIKLKHIVSSF